MSDHPQEIVMAAEAILVSWFNAFNVDENERDIIVIASCDIIAKLIEPLIKRRCSDAILEVVKAMVEGNSFLNVYGDG